MRENMQIGRRRFAQVSGGAVVALSGVSVVGKSETGFKEAYLNTISLRKENDWSVSAWRDHLTDKGINYRSRDGQGTKDTYDGLSKDADKSNATISLTFSFDGNGKFIDFTYTIDSSDTIGGKGLDPVDRVSIGYSDDDYVRDDYYTGPNTFVDDSVDSFGPTGSAVAYDDRDAYAADKSADSFRGYYGEYLKVKGGTSSTRKLFVDWYHTGGLADFEGISFDPLPAIIFNDNSEKWVKEDEAFEDQI